MLATKSFRPAALVMLLMFGLAALTLSLLSSQPVRDLKLPRIVPPAALGLSREHHGELNRMSVPVARYDELRREYEGNPAAQQQIDVYDPVTEYHVQFKKFVDAFKASDEEKIAELEQWFKEHYPDIGGMNNDSN